MFAEATNTLSGRLSQGPFALQVTMTSTSPTFRIAPLCDRISSGLADYVYTSLTSPLRGVDLTFTHLL